AGVYQVHRGGEVKNLDAAQVAGSPHVARTTTMSMIAVREAMADAGLTSGSFDPARTGVLVGTTSGEVQDMEALDASWTLGRFEAFTDTAYAGFCSNSIPARLAPAFGFAGPALVLANACASGTFAGAF